MELLTSLLLTLLVAICSALVPWGVKRIKRIPLAAAFAVGIALTTTGIAPPARNG